tara:strand:+ start:850 stop:1227 length:378 start_codon:yes stop_codon:yes gene_type:complete
MYTYNAKCERVVDGDTIDCLIDLGFSVWKKVRVRLDGMNAPESRTRDKEEKKLGLAAKARLQQIMDLNDGNIHLKVNGIGKYGRALGEILVKKVGTTADISLTMTQVNKLLIKEGHATEYFGGKR